MEAYSIVGRFSIRFINDYGEFKNFRLRTSGRSSDNFFVKPNGPALFWVGGEAAGKHRTNPLYQKIIIFSRRNFPRRAVGTPTTPTFYSGLKKPGFSGDRVKVYAVTDA